MERTFTTFEITKAFPEIKYQRLREWIDRGHFTPSTRARGVTTKHLFTRWDVYSLLLFNELLFNGFSREEAQARIKTMAMDRDKHEKVGTFNIQEYELLVINRDPGREVLIRHFSQQEGGQKSFNEIFDLVSSGGDFTRLVVINFKRIMERADAGLP